MSDLSVKLYTALWENDKRRDDDHWHASSLAKCPREQYFERLGVAPTQKPTGAKVLRWQVGHKVEEVIRPYLLGLYPNLQSNVRLSKGSLTGEYDNYDPDSKTLIEIKSVHPFAMGHLEKKPEPYLHHIVQNHAYVELMGGEPERITFIYIGLDGRLMDVTIEVDPEYLSLVRKRLTALDEAWEAKTPPDCICNQTDHPLYKCQMQYCSYKEKDECCSLALLESDVTEETIKAADEWLLEVSKNV